MQNVLIVDGSQALFKTLLIGRYEPILTDTNTDVGAVPYFFINLQRAIQQINPSQIIVVWDGGSSSWSKRRLALYPNYKASRREKTEEQKAKVKLFAQQKPIITLLFRYFGISNLELPATEADDVIAQLCYQLNPSWRAVILSDDRDFRQLVSETVSLFCPMAGLTYNMQGLQPDKIKHSQYLLFKSCFGDPSDNIYGIPDVGKITLEKVFADFNGNTAGELYLHLYKMLESGQGGKKVQTLFDGFDTVLLNWQLMDLSKETFSEDQLDKIKSSFVTSPIQVNEQRIYEVFDKFRFTGLTANFIDFIAPFKRMHLAFKNLHSMQGV